jgi:hypothetical protein
MPTSQVGLFAITPCLVDRSAYGGHAMPIVGGGRRRFTHYGLVVKL